MALGLGSTAGADIVVDPAPSVEICAADDGVRDATAFEFTVSYAGANASLSVMAGSCERLFVAPGSSVTVAETVPTGIQVTAIAVDPGDRVVEGPDLEEATVVVRSGGFGDVVQVSFTNVACKPGKGRGDKNHCHQGVTPAQG